MTIFMRFFTKATRNTLKREFSRETTRALIKDMWQHYNELSPGLPEGISPTGQFLMKTSGACLALFYTLVGEGIEENKARQIVADVNWSFIGGGSLLGQGMIRLQYKLSKLVNSDPVKRLDWCLAPLWRFIFTTPPWKKKNLPSDDGILALDVVRCPWADYFRSVGQQELGALAFCGADLKLAKIWGFDLKRDGLLMTGAPYCDFRFIPKTNR